LTVASLWVLCSGVAASFQLSPKLLGATPGGSFQVVGSRGLPVGPVYGKSADALEADASVASATTKGSASPHRLTRASRPCSSRARGLTWTGNAMSAGNLRRALRLKTGA
jgi:hypothetical protein